MIPKPASSVGGTYSTHFILNVSPVFSSADLAIGYERYLSFPLFLPLDDLFVNFELPTNLCAADLLADSSNSRSPSCLCAFCN